MAEVRKQKTENRGQKTENRGQKTEGREAENRKQKTEQSNSKPNSTVLTLFSAFCPLTSAHPNPQCDSGKNRRPGDRAKPDFDKLLRVGAWGRASGSRVEAHSTTPSARVACPWGANRRYDTKFTQTVLIALLCSVLCSLFSDFLPLCLSALCSKQNYIKIFRHKFTFCGQLISLFALG